MDASYYHHSGKYFCAIYSHQYQNRLRRPCDFVGRGRSSDTSRRADAPSKPRSCARSGHMDGVPAPREDHWLLLMAVTLMCAWNT